MPKILPRIALIGALVLLSACQSLRAPMTDFATDYNRVIADTRNQMILLNILRAQHREPLYYSSVSQIEGSISVTAGMELGASFEGDGDPETAAAHSVSPSMNLNVGSDPSFVIVPLSSNEFVRGALTPVRAETLVLLLSQGWPSELLAPLLIERIECPAFEGAPARVLVNDPDETIDGMTSLQYFSGIRMEIATRRDDAFDLVISDDDVAGLLMESAASNYEIAQAQHSTPSETAAGRSRITLAPTERGGVDFFRTDTRQANAAPAPICPSGGEVALAGQRVTGSGPTVRLRSTEGIIYYLGELLRSGRPAVFTRLRRGETQRIHLLDVNQGRGPAAVAVTYRGQPFFLAEQAGNDTLTGFDNQDRSLQVISLVNQLLALQTSTEDLSRVSRSVRVR